MKKLMKRIVSTVTIAMVIAMSLLGCGGSNGKESEGAISLGASFPLTGSIAADGQTCVDAINLVIKQTNEAGGINGRMLELESGDDEGSPTSAASIANKFVDEDNILAVVSSYNSSCMLAQVDIYDEAGLPCISPVATTPALTGASKYFYRTAPNDADCGSYAGDFLKEMGISKVALFYENDDYGLGLAEAFEEKCAEIGIDIVTTQTYVYGETVDYSTQLTATSGSGAEAIFVCGCVTEMGLICDQRSDYGCGDMMVLLSNGGYAPALLEYNTEGVYVQGEFDSAQSEKAKEFVEAFKNEYGYEPGNWAASAYDSASIVVAAMKECGSDISRNSINDAISKISYEGVCGNYTFVNCNSTKDELMFQVVDKSFSLIK